MSQRIHFPPYRPVPLDRLFRGGSPDQYGCIATAEPVLQALAGWETIAGQFNGLQACINETLKGMPGIENVQVVDVGSFFPGMGEDALASVNYGTANLRFERALVVPATNAKGDPTGIFGWALSSIVQGEGVYALSAAKFANPKSVFDMMNGILQYNWNHGVGAYNPPKKAESATQAAPTAKSEEAQPSTVEPPTGAAPADTPE